MSEIRIEHWAWEKVDWGKLDPFFVTADLSHIPAGVKREGRETETHLVVALSDDQMVGGLFFLVQPIGPEMDIPVVCDPSSGEPLMEAKIRAFFVLPEMRNKGIGTRLQQAILGKAAELGCFQVRSRSEPDKDANYAIKLKLGFAMHPAYRVFDETSRSAGVYWVKAV